MKSSSPESQLSVNVIISKSVRGNYRLQSLFASHETAVFLLLIFPMYRICTVKRNHFLRFQVNTVRKLKLERFYCAHVT